MNKTRGIFTISLDFELYWGIRDKCSLKNYRTNLDGVENAINKILNIFNIYNIHATWATVGFLFYENMRNLKNNLPVKTPSYKNEFLNPYIYIKNNTLEEKYHFSPSCIKSIINSKNQEIATHTMSHYYCLEHGQRKDEFYEDLRNSIKIIEDKTNQKTYSLVFPRNQWNEEYLSILSELGILSYRGNEESWIYDAVNEKNINYVRRAIRLIDTYINVSGHHTYSLKNISLKKPFNIPSSRFLRPVSKQLSFLETIRLNRIKKSMTYAAKNNELYHLWWHPHNFGKDLDDNILFLNEILKHYKRLETKYGMRSLNMKEVSLSLLEQYDK